MCRKKKKHREIADKQSTYLFVNNQGIHIEKEANHPSRVCASRRQITNEDCAYITDVTRNVFHPNSCYSLGNTRVIALSPLGAECRTYGKRHATPPLFSSNGGLVALTTGEPSSLWVGLCNRANTFLLRICCVRRNRLQCTFHEACTAIHAV